MIEGSYRGWVKETETWYQWETHPQQGSSEGRNITEEPVHRLAHPGTEQKSSCLKGTYTMMKEIHLLTLKRLPNEQRVSETVSVLV